MKISVLLLLIFTCISLISCESEYDKRMKNAKELVKQELELKSSVAGDPDASVFLKEALTDLENDIHFHAHISGNEKVFLEELNDYRRELLNTQPAAEDRSILISKYP